MITLSDISAVIPDWPLVLVYSDYLEDTNDLNTANALRWLYKWDHWPYFASNHITCWWCSRDYSNSELHASRYGRCSGDVKRDKLLLPNLLSATLPPEYYKTAGRRWGDPLSLYSSTLEDALTWFCSTYSLIGDITPTIYRPAVFPELPRGEESIASLVEGTKGRNK